MLRVYGCITNEHDIRLVVLAGLICFLACYTAFSLIARSKTQDIWSRYSWLTGAAVVTGSGVWATHFIAMLAFRPGLPVGYDVALTALSVLIAAGASALGYIVALRGHAAIGGAMVGLSIGAMHYVGMAALRIPAQQVWDVNFVIASLVIGGGFGAAALVASKHEKSLGWRLAAAGMLTLGICGLHFVAMAAVSFMPDPTIVVPQQTIAPEWLAVAITAVTLLILGMGLVGSIVDQHLAQRSADEATRLREHVAELEETKLKLENTTRQLTIAYEAAAAGNQTKSQFLATMSHELRTPLNAIIGFAEILKGELFGPIQNERYKTYAGSIYDSGSHLLGLINDILDISKLDTGHLEITDEAVNINRTVSACIELVEAQASKAGVRLITAVDSKLPFLMADSRRVRQILINLLSNAVKFTPENGQVRVSAYRHGDGLAIAVADTGIGMAAKDIPKALERFGQIDSALARKYEGTGLGLPLAKHLMELHGGTLSIESTLGKGTTVTVVFPLDRVLARVPEKLSA